MTRAKSNPQHNLVIKSHRPERAVLLSVAVLVLLLVVAALSFTLGRSSREDSGRLDEHKQQLREARNRVIGLQQQTIVEKMATEDVRQSIGKLEEQIQQLNKVIAFYRGIMAPEALATGLHVQNLDIESLEAVNNYRLHWVLIQVGNNEQLVQGDVELRINGIMESATVGGAAVEVVAKKFKFRYFQEFEADIILPAGFQPAQIEAIASLKGKSSQKISRKFDWLIDGSFADVAQ